jgi:tight adherence protein C
LISEAGAQWTAGLLGLAAAGGVAGIAELARVRRGPAVDRWRDPSPRLFRLLLPLARLIHAEVDPTRWFPPRGLAARLDRAGMGYAVLPGEWMVLRGLTAVLTVVAALVLQPALESLDAVGAGSVLAGLVLGYAYPAIWLRDQGQRRQRLIARQFPALLELLGLSVRAGLSFSAALPQCTRYLEPGPLRAEMQRIDRDTRTGVARLEALERMARRVDLSAVHGFVAAIAQAEETGAAISQTLSDQAAQRRRERFAAAEKKANEAPVKMLAPLVGLLFPVTFLIIGFPIVLQFMEGGLL